MNLPNLSQPVIKAKPALSHSGKVMPSIDTGCVLSKCGLGALKCIPAYLLGGLPAVIACLGSAAPDCIACFT